MTIDLAILYEHPAWFMPLFAALDRTNIEYQAVTIGDHSFDPGGSQPRARVVFNRVAMSSFLRDAEHPIFYAQALFDHLQGLGTRVVNGSAALAIDASKARQLSLLARLNLGIPATRVVHRRAALPAAAASLRFPVVVKADIGGSGAGIIRYDTPDALSAAVADGTTPVSVNGVLLVQEYVPRRGGMVTRIETLGGKFLYAIDIASDGDTFDLCPADACSIDRAPVTFTAVQPPPELIDAAERIAAAAQLDVGGIEFLIDDRDGAPRFYDINALSNFVAQPLDVLGWDPHDRLVTFLRAVIEEAR